MNILVMGGSYFLGRYFVYSAMKEHKITVFNRGNCPFDEEGITELKGDRHVPENLMELKDLVFDVVVDFCAYAKGDIEGVLAQLKNPPEQYVFVSTVDVYQRGLGYPVGEQGPLEERKFPGEAGAYISGKVQLEREILECCAQKKVNYTIIRPAFIYGPGNYAPREEMYFNWIEQAGQIIHPKDATGEFQMVYVGDVVRALLAVVSQKQAYNQAYNITGEKVETYNSFESVLAMVSKKPYEKIELSIQEIIQKNIPLPFPLSFEESNWYRGEKIQELIGEYTSLEEGMKKTISSR